MTDTPDATPPTTSKPILVLGGTGGFGGGVARELIERGHGVKLLVRDLARARVRFGDLPNITYVQGDVQNGAELARLSEKCGAIVHGVNLPYHLWKPNMGIATDNVIGAARAHNLLILFPGNVYELGRHANAPLDENAPNQPCSETGEFRVQLEDKLRNATVESGARVIIVRAGDYFGPSVRNGLVDPIFLNAKEGKPIRMIGNLDAPHEWVYMPDLARAAVDLLEKSEEFESFEVVHFRGHRFDRQREFLSKIAEVAGHPNLKLRSTPWSLLRMLAFFNPVVRALLELRYLFDEAVMLDDTKLQRLLPGFEHTPINRAIGATLRSYSVAKS